MITTMRLPTEQSKLLFLYLLRSSAHALAISESPLTSKITASMSTRSLTSSTSSSSLSASSSANYNFSPVSSSSSSSSSTTTSTSSPSSSDGYITVRLATRLDVPSIQRCNLATLPENYSSNFYVNHLQKWPDLAIVAEHVPIIDSNSGRTNTVTRPKNPLQPYDPSNRQDQPQIIGYVLGKVEKETQLKTIPSSLSSSSSSSFKNNIGHNFPPSKVVDSSYYNDNTTLLRYDPSFTQQQQQQPHYFENLGHVTSLAILPSYRRRGLASILMKQLHHHMQSNYSRVLTVGLHVRVSNLAARRLYCEEMGYVVKEVIKGYYQDGEDAYYMKKNLLSHGSGVDDEYDSIHQDSEKDDILHGTGDLCGDTLLQHHDYRDDYSTGAGNNNDQRHIKPWNFPWVRKDRNKHYTNSWEMNSSPSSSSSLQSEFQLPKYIPLAKPDTAIPTTESSTTTHTDRQDDCEETSKEWPVITGRI